MRHPSWRGGLAFLLLFLLVAAAQAEMSAFLWTREAGLTELGPRMCARAITNQRQICGEFWTEDDPTMRAFKLSPAHGFVELETPSGYEGSECFDLNARGSAVGAAYMGIEESFRAGAMLWTKGRAIQLDWPGDSSAALAINGRGQVAGWIERGGDRKAVLWSSRRGLTELGTLGGERSVATAINNRGQVAGISDTATGSIHAFLWTRHDGMTDLGTLGGASSRAWALNGGGVVVGTSQTPSGATHAVVWTPGGGQLDLGPMDGEGGAFGVNSRLEVSGRQARPGEAFQAHLWTAGGDRPLVTDPEVTESLAWAINARGDVVGYLRRE